MKISRILMNEADASPGGGAVTPQTPAEPAAQPVPDATVVPLDQVKALMSTMAAEIQNGVFANLRKAGVFEKGKQAPVEPATPAPTTAAEQERVTFKSLQAELEDMKLRTRYERGARRHKFDDSLDEDAYQLYKAQKPEDDTAWFSGKQKIFGVKESTSVTTTAAPAAPAPPPQGPQPHPISDKGSPAPGGVLDFEREVQSNPIGASKAAREAYLAKYGQAEGNRKIIEMAASAVQRIKVTR